MNTIFRTFVTELHRIFMHLLEILKFKNMYIIRIVCKNVYKMLFIIIYRSFLSKFDLIDYAA